MYVTASNTWQGVIYGTWQNTIKPLRVIGEFSQKSHNMYHVPIKVTERSYLNSNGNFFECLETEKPIGESCKSIFHPKSYKENNRSVSESSLKVLLLFSDSTFYIHSALCQNLQDHNQKDREMKETINTCLNQTKYKVYISDVELESIVCKNPPMCATQFLIRPKIYKILAYDEMLIIDEIELLCNLGGLLGLFSIFGNASILLSRYDSRKDKA